MKEEKYLKLLEEQDIALLNDNSPTHYHIQTNTYSTIDLSICSSDCLMDFTYKTLDNLHDSDHYPIQISTVGEYTNQDTIERYNTKRADWSLYRELTQTEMEPAQVNTVDELTNHISTIVLDAAELSIPVKGGKYKKRPLPW